MFIFEGPDFVCIYGEAFKTALPRPKKPQGTVLRCCPVTCFVDHLAAEASPWAQHCSYIIYTAMQGIIIYIMHIIILYTIIINLYIILHTGGIAAEAIYIRFLYSARGVVTIIITSYQCASCMLHSAYNSNRI